MARTAPLIPNSSGGAVPLSLIATDLASTPRAVSPSMGREVFATECPMSAVQRTTDSTQTSRHVRVVPIKVVLGGGTQFLECRAFQTAEVAFAGRRLLKDMLCHFKRRDRFTCLEASMPDKI